MLVSIAWIMAKMTKDSPRVRHVNMKTVIGVAVFEATFELDLLMIVVYFEHYVLMAIDLLVAW